MIIVFICVVLIFEGIDVNIFFIVNFWLGWGCGDLLWYFMICWKVVVYLWSVNGEMWCLKFFERILLVIDCEIVVVRMKFEYGWFVIDVLDLYLIFFVIVVFCFVFFLWIFLIFYWKVLFFLEGVRFVVVIIF